MLDEGNISGWNFDNSYSTLPRTMFSELLPTKVASPEVLLVNLSLLKELGLVLSGSDLGAAASVFSGNNIPSTSKSIAQAYAGHQFGYFTNLGDGRALLIGEQITPKNKRFDIQLKGAGRTPYSRGGDGRAAIGPALREYLISEAMHNLKIPTTRSLAVVKTGELVLRDKELSGAIITRVASSHIRIGTFEYLAAINKTDYLEILTKYTIGRHYSKIKWGQGAPLLFFKEVMKKQISLVLDWARVGFIHGVMNTDNVSISGETIDYGPCAFMDKYNPNTVFSSIDLEGRYCFKNQPSITKWNLLQLAKCLLPIVNKDLKKAGVALQEVLNSFDEMFEEAWIIMMRKKMGLLDSKEGDGKLAKDLLGWMYEFGADYTNTFTLLKNPDVFKKKYIGNKIIMDWYGGWKKRRFLGNYKINDSINLMKKNNPEIIPRNHIVEDVIKSVSDKKDLKPLNKFLNLLKKPYVFKGNNYYTEPLNDINYKTFCGT